MTKLCEEILQFVKNNNTIRIRNNKKEIISSEIYMSDYGAKISNSKSIEDFKYIKKFIMDHEHYNNSLIKIINELSQIGYNVYDDLVTFSVNPFKCGIYNIEFLNFNNHFHFKFYE